MQQRRKRRKRRQKSKFALRRKKWLVILLCIAFLASICAGVSYYFLNNKAGKQLFASVKKDEPVDNGTSQNLNSIKVGFWNILNYDDNPTKVGKKFQQENLAKVIKHLNPDVIGLVEVNSGDPKKPNSVANLTKKLNELENAQTYTSITSDPVFGEGNEGSTERYLLFIKNQ
ncbi:hypothetical protein [Mycoplasma sp. 1654_15]|uniref:hypothetical protein n=1 Tax=Mycoplasma sp. 1654_15 TaxID=2725994 RepID=UPI001449B1A5|nr:hypothetical protein [Mycoplasma sp. 1654_15]QJB71396.1 hypothetical protein HF996_02865 [Mycoplasma sp. 1654_15]